MSSTWLLSINCHIITCLFVFFRISALPGNTRISIKHSQVSIVDLWSIMASWSSDLQTDAIPARVSKRPNKTASLGACRSKTYITTLQRTQSHSHLHRKHVEHGSSRSCYQTYLEPQTVMLGFLNTAINICQHPEPATTFVPVICVPDTAWTQIKIQSNLLTDIILVMC